MLGGFFGYMIDKFTLLSSPSTPILSTSLNPLQDSSIKESSNIDIAEKQQTKVLNFATKFCLNSTTADHSKIYNNYQKVTDKFMDVVDRNCRYKFVMELLDFQQLCFPILIEDIERSDNEGWSITEILGYTKPEMMYLCTLRSDFNIPRLIENITIENDLQTELLQRLMQQHNGNKNYTVYLPYDIYKYVRDKHEDESYIYTVEFYNIFTHIYPESLPKQRVRELGYKILDGKRELYDKRS